MVRDCIYQGFLIKAAGFEIFREEEGCVYGVYGLRNGALLSM